MSKWINCRKCGHEYSSQLSHCPQCSCFTVNLKFISTIAVCIAVVGIAVAGFAIGLRDKSGEDLISNEQTSSNTSENKQTSFSDSKTEGTQSGSKTEVDVDAQISSVGSITVSSSVIAETSSTETSSKETQSVSPVTHTPKVGTELWGDLYYITLPEYYLRSVYSLFGLEATGISFDEYAYQLDEEAKTKGFSTAKKNADGSSTRTIGNNKYHAYLTEFTSSVLKLTFEIKRLDFIESIKSSNNFNSFEIKLNKEEITQSEYAQILILGCTAIEKQFSTVNSNNSCTINLTFSNGKTETIKFPDILKTK